MKISLSKGVLTIPNTLSQSEVGPYKRSLLRGFLFNLLVEKAELSREEAIVIADAVTDRTEIEKYKDNGTFKKVLERELNMRCDKNLVLTDDSFLTIKEIMRVGGKYNG